MQSHGRVPIQYSILTTVIQGIDWASGKDYTIEFEVPLNLHMLDGSWGRHHRTVRVFPGHPTSRVVTVQAKCICNLVSVAFIMLDKFDRETEIEKRALVEQTLLLQHRNNQQSASF